MLIISIIFLLLVVVFAVQNAQMVPIMFLTWSLDLNLALVVLGRLHQSSSALCGLGFGDVKRGRIKKPASAERCQDKVSTLERAMNDLMNHRAVNWSSEGRRRRVSLLFREWRIPEPPDSCLIDRVRNEASVLPEVAALLLQRSGGDIERARQMREHGEVAIPDVLSLPGVKEAALRILEAISSGQRIVAYSDFDADGVTSAAVIKEALGFAGAADVQVYFPSRFTEGYGFHARSVREIASPGKCLIITSDCGITAVEGCAEAEKLGCDVIITDHHLPGETLPQAHSILNPHLPSWGEAGLQGLTGAGVAYLLAQALFEVAGVRAKVPLRWGHDLLVLSIAGDGQPLTGLNRRFVVSGLRVLSEARRPGISALLEAAGIGRPDPLQPGCCTSLSFDRDVTFGLVPRLNAAGRLEDARLAYDILVETDPARVRSLALRLDELNRKRKGIEDAIMAQCVGDLEASSGDSYAVCAARSEWHEGVIGIQRQTTRNYARPAALQVETVSSKGKRERHPG